MANSQTPAPEANGLSEGFITRAEAAQMIRDALSSLRVYVVESDITEAQNSVRAIVEQASF